MPVEAPTTWSQAQAYDFKNGGFLEKIYLAKVLPTGHNFTLDGYISAKSDTKPNLEILFNGGFMRYSQSDVQFLEECLLGKNSMFTQIGLDSMMAHRNLQALGLTFEQAEKGLYSQIPFPTKTDVYGITLTPLYNKLMVWGAGREGSDPETVEAFAQQINQRLGIFTVEPFDFEEWKKVATADFDTVRLF